MILLLIHTIRTQTVMVWYAWLLTFFQLSLQKRCDKLILKPFYCQPMFYNPWNVKSMPNGNIWHAVNGGEGFPTFWGYSIPIYWQFGFYKRHWCAACALTESLYSTWRSPYSIVWIYSSNAKLWLRVSCSKRLTFLYYVNYSFSWLGATCAKDSSFKLRPEIHTRVLLNVYQDTFILGLALHRFVCSNCGTKLRLCQNSRKVVSQLTWSNQLLKVRMPRVK